jgi:DNA-binding NarL/FixJ family response regulator
LAKITVRKAINERRHALAKKRGTGKVRDNAEMTRVLVDIAGNEPTPDILVAINEECDRLIDVLDGELRPVARMKLEGYTNAEIAESLGRVERTVERKLERIRHIWLGENDARSVADGC